MATQTTKLGLIKPSYNEAADIDVINENMDIIDTAFNKQDGSINTHLTNKSNPHEVTKSQVGLGNVNNTADANKNVLSATKLTTARKINGVNFDGTQDITTPNARKYTLSGYFVDHYDFVIPMHELDNTIIDANFYFQGDIYLKRMNTLTGLHNKISIVSSKNHNTTTPIFSMNITNSNNKVAFSVVKYTHNGKTWCGLLVSPTASCYALGTFIGETTTNWTDNVIQCINTYDKRTKQVLNAEVYNSIEVQGDPRTNEFIGALKAGKFEGDLDGSNINVSSATMGNAYITGDYLNFENDGGELDGIFTINGYTTMGHMKVQLSNIEKSNGIGTFTNAYGATTESAVMVMRSNQTTAGLNWHVVNAWCSADNTIKMIFQDSNGASTTPTSGAVSIWWSVERGGV